MILQQATEGHSTSNNLGEALNYAGRDVIVRKLVVQYILKKDGSEGSDSLLRHRLGSVLTDQDMKRIISNGGLEGEIYDDRVRLPMSEVESRKLTAIT